MWMLMACRDPASSRWSKNSKNSAVVTQGRVLHMLAVLGYLHDLIDGAVDDGIEPPHILVVGRLDDGPSGNSWSAGGQSPPSAATRSTRSCLFADHLQLLVAGPLAGKRHGGQGSK